MEQNELEKMTTTFLEDVENLINSAIVSLRQAKQKTTKMKRQLLVKESNQSQINNNSRASGNLTTLSRSSRRQQTEQRTIVEALDLALASSPLLHNHFDKVTGDNNNKSNINTIADAHKD